MEAPFYLTITGFNFLMSFLLSLHVHMSSQLLQSESVSLISSLNGQREVRRGENITFQCTIRGLILAWSSNEYIGDRIEFLVVDNIGIMRTSNAYTTAVLVNVSTDRNGHKIIESHLTAVVQSNIPSSSITCHNVDSGDTRNIPFQLSNTPILTCEGTRTVCPGDFRNFSCEIRSSSILAWENDEYIGPCGSRLEFLSTEPVGTIKFSEINTGVFANLTDRYDANGIQVMKCELSISKFEYHPDAINVVCLNVGLGTKNSYELTVNHNNCDTTISDESLTSATVTSMEISESVNTVHSGSDTAEVEKGVSVVGITVAIILTVLL